MEISDHGIYNLVVVARCNNNLRTGVQRFHIMAVQVIENGLQRFYRCDTCSLFSCLIRLPLMNMKFFFCCIRIFQKGDTDMIETFQCSYGGSTYGNCFSVVGNQIFNCPARNRYIFGLKVPAPTCNVNSSKSTPFSFNAFNTRGVKCNPAVGAATEPFILE